MNKHTYPGLFLFLIAGSFMLLFGNTVKAQDLQASIENSISEGDAEALAVHFGESVDIGLPYADEDYGKTQAEMVMKSFFEKEPPDSFQIKESGSTAETSKFFIGEYISGKKKYTLLIMLRQNEDSFLIHKLKFQEKKPE
jgi:hypothetical protein